ncbi:MAG: tetratricopeptide repeat protein [Candidatus Anammoxibacter sp.]
MECSKIGGSCPHPVAKDNEYVFVMMPFGDSTNVYDAIKQSVANLDGKQFKCDRADEQYTNLSIWCRRICTNIRKAKYLIVDTSGSNPNVFYELGFSHALEGTKAIIITRNVKEAPFDISDLNHIPYTVDDLPDLRNKLKNALLALENEEKEEDTRRKSSDEIIQELNAQIREEEKRAAHFKEDLVKTEEREKKLKEQIREVEKIRDNPEEEAKNKITHLEGTIAELKSKQKYTEKEKKEEIKKLSQQVKEKEEKLRTLENDLKKFKEEKVTSSLSDKLMDDAQKRSEASKWFSKAYKETDINKKVAYYTKAIELDPNDAIAYSNRGVSYNDLKEYEKAIIDCTKAIELDPNDAITYYNRGISYSSLKEHEKVISDYTKAIESDPNYANVYINFPEVLIITGKYKESLEIIEKASSIKLVLENAYDLLYLECVTKKLLKLDTSECERKFDEIHKKDFSISWNTEPMESWLKTAQISEEIKKYIQKMTDKLKEHIR